MTDPEMLTLKEKKYKIEYIGEGGFAKVYKGTCLDGSGQLVAIKKVSKKDDKWQTHEKYVKQEIEIHEKLNHPNIVKLHEVFKDEDAIYLIMELCDCSLHDYLKKRKGGCKTEKDVYNIFKQIVEGVQYLHSIKAVIHRDLSTRNILLTKDMQVKIADFGLSTSNEEDVPKKTLCGTLQYMAPEMKEGKGHTEKVDCYSLGIILHELLFGITRDTKNGKKGLAMNIHGRTNKKISSEAKELCEKLLAVEPSKRLNIEAVAYSEFFKKNKRISESKNSLYRSNDSGNGSRNHFSSFIEKESLFRSLDSGFNSKTSSGKKNKLNSKNCHSKEKLTERQYFDLQKHRLLPTRKHLHDRNRSASEDRKLYKPLSYNSPQHDYYSHERSASAERKPYKPLSYNNPHQEYNSRERSASAERERIENLNLPYCREYSNDDRSIISSDCYKGQGRYKRDDCGINSAGINHRNCNPEPTGHCEDPSCRFSNSLLEGQHKVSPSTCSHSGCYDIKCSHVTTCRCHSYSYHKHHPSNVNKPEKLNDQGLEQLTPPLNAARLRPKRYMPKDLNNTVLHISRDRQVIMETLKTKKGKVYVSEVFVISTDGMEIKIYKPPKNTLLDNDHPPPFPNNSKEIKSYDYQKLPTIYHAKYRVAKKFVDILRAKKPKLINNGPNARFYVMENSPDPDMKMEFYDGGSVIKKDLIYITDRLGRKCVVYDVANNLDQNFKSMLEEFLNEKEDCERILKFLESFRSPNFPVVLGTAEIDLNCSGQKTGKENFAPISSKSNRR